MAESDGGRAGVQVWGAVVGVGSALAVVTAYLINGAPLVLGVAGVEVLLLMVHVARRWRALHRQPSPAGHRPLRGAPDAAHCERCRRAREALDARQAREGGAGRAASGRAEQPESGAADRPQYPRRPQSRAPYERPWTAERAAARSVDRTTARRGAPGSAGRAVRHQ
ncbi:hypothetical protein ABT247_24225 [Kitasatospora sp. NPDC001539]|uniref:hypothetical protein n=1 Tax=Kitasatospora sp. NPDC001539 TaxID=3154384 RepID=UPI003319DC2D